MSRTRWLLLAMAFLVSITALTASPGTVGAAPEPNKPIVLPVDETFLAPNLTNHCGFDVWAHVFGTFTFKVLPNGVELDRNHIQYVFSGPGGSLDSVKRIENVKYTATTSPDGTLVETITATGMLPLHNVVPGYGSLSNNSGREIIQFTWRFDEELGGYVLEDELVLFDAGPNDELSDAEFAVKCAELA